MDLYLNVFSPVIFKVLKEITPQMDTIYPIYGVHYGIHYVLLFDNVYDNVNRALVMYRKPLLEY